MDTQLRGSYNLTMTVLYYQIAFLYARWRSESLTFNLTSVTSLFNTSLVWPLLTCFTTCVSHPFGKLSYFYGRDNFPVSITHFLGGTIHRSELLYYCTIQIYSKKIIIHVRALKQYLFIYAPGYIFLSSMRIQFLYTRIYSYFHLVELNLKRKECVLYQSGVIQSNGNQLFSYVHFIHNFPTFTFFLGYLHPLP